MKVFMTKLSGLIKNRQKSASKSLLFDRILIVQTAFIGDVILTTPLIRETQSRFPLARIDVLVIPKTADVLRNNPFVNEIILFDKHKGKWPELLRVIRQVRSNHYDLILSPHGSLTTGLILQFSGTRKKIAFKGASASWFASHRVKKQKNLRAIERHLSLLTAFNHTTDQIQTEIYPDIFAVSKIQNLLASLSHRHRQKIILAPGSVWATKRWPIEYYTNLAVKLEQAGFQVILTGSSAEKTLCDKVIIDGELKHGWNVAGALTLRESAALIAESDLVICNDSAVLHIANAMETPVFAFFGPTVKSFGFSPIGEEDRVFEVNIGCRPCGKHGHQSCPSGHHLCMRLLAPDDVFNAVIQKFRREHRSAEV